jgi:hypothetical protein
LLCTDKEEEEEEEEKGLSVQDRTRRGVMTTMTMFRYAKA